jgi:hypothetical protein
MLPSKSDSSLPSSTAVPTGQFKDIVASIQKWAGNLAMIGFRLITETRPDESIHDHRNRSSEYTQENTLEILANITNLKPKSLLTRWIRKDQDPTTVIFQSPRIERDSKRSFGGTRVICRGKNGFGRVTIFRISDSLGPMILEETFAFFRSAILGAYAGANGIANLPNRIAKSQDSSSMVPAPLGGLGTPSLKELSSAAIKFAGGEGFSTYEAEDFGQQDMVIRLAIPRIISADFGLVHTEAPDGHIKITAHREGNPKKTLAIDFNYKTGEISLGERDDPSAMRIIDRVSKVSDAAVWVNGFVAGFAAGTSK